MPLIHDHPQRPPSGDFDFTDDGVTLRDKSLQGLLDAIALFRSNNAMLPGNPSAEVEDYYRDAYPWLVTVVGETPTAKQDPVAKWINRIWALAPRKFLDTIPAQMRMDVCVACQFYEADHTLDTEMTRRLTILGAGRVKGTAVCEAHHWNISLATLLEKPDVAVVIDGCWASHGDATSPALPSTPPAP